MQKCGSCAPRETTVEKLNSSFRLRFWGRSPIAAVWIAILLIGNGSALLGQETPKQETPKPAEQGGSPSSTQPAPKAPTRIPGKGFYNLLEKKSIVFPDIAASTEALSPGQKFKLFVDNSISLHSITWAAMGAGIGQAADSPTGFGEGGDAYAKRFGSEMARNSSSEFFGTFVLASALHQDPRFFPESNPSFGGAVKYSVRSLFVTRSDAGQNVPNVSGLMGPALGEALANAYWPERNRTVGDTLLRYGIDLAARAGGNMLREYWPVFYGKLRHSDRAGARRPEAAH